MDKQLFFEACNRATENKPNQNKIGTLGEKTLHSVLKYYFQPNLHKHEVLIDGYVADIADENGIMEIQTGNFSKLRKKLAVFLEREPVTIIYPVAYRKWLSWCDMQTGEISAKRKSPKRGTPYEIFPELYRIKHLLTHRNLKLCIVMLDMEEYRILNGWSADKKKGSSRYERIPVDIRDEVCINSKIDYIKLIPGGMPVLFTTRDYKKASGISMRVAQTALHILHTMGTVKRVGKKGNAFLYEVANDTTCGREV